MRLIKTLIICFFSLSIGLGSYYFSNSTSIKPFNERIEEKIESITYNLTNLEKQNLYAKALQKIGHLKMKNPSQDLRDSITQIETIIRSKLSRALLERYQPRQTNKELSLAEEVIQYTNTIRKERNLQPLRLNGKLSQASEMYADEMAEQNFFEHQSPQGVGYINRLEAVGYHYTYISENLGQGYTSGKTLVDARLRSPTHRVNVLAPEASEMGFGFDTVKTYSVALYASQEEIGIVPIIEADKTTTTDAFIIRQNNKKKFTP